MNRLILIAGLALTLSGCPQTDPVAASTPSPEQASPPAIALSDNPTLGDTIRVLAEDIGERHLARYEELEKARVYISDRLKRAGYRVESQTFRDKIVKKDAYNLIASKPGNDEIVVIGAHYDSATLTPGANDNASGVAVLLQLADRLAKTETERTVRFAFFVNEEPPFFMTSDMGSTVYAKQCAQKKENIVGMLSLETLGYYSDEPASQHFPPGITGYPNTGNFLAFIAEPNSEELLRECLDNFQGLPVESLVAPAQTEGVSWSDHASFWRYGYQAVMVTDTAPFRYPHYHKPSDTPDKINEKSLERAAEGLESVVRALAREKKPQPNRE